MILSRLCCVERVMKTDDKTVTLDESIEVQRNVRDVFDYIAAFHNVQEWDPGVKSARKLTDGPVVVGSEFEVVMNFGLRLTYTLVDMTEGERLEFQVTSRLFDAHEEILFCGNTQQASVRYIARFSFREPMGTFARLRPESMESVGKQAVEGMRAALEDEPDAPAASRATAPARRHDAHVRLPAARAARCRRVHSREGRPSRAPWRACGAGRRSERSWRTAPAAVLACTERGSHAALGVHLSEGRLRVKRVE